MTANPCKRWRSLSILPAQQRRCAGGAGALEPTDRARGRRIRFRLRGLVVVIVTATGATACGFSSRRAPDRAMTHVRPKTKLASGSGGLILPATYQQACLNESAVCVQGVSGPLPAALHRPLHFPVVRRGQRCPVSSGFPVGNRYLAGLALGRGPVRPLIASAGDVRHGIADLDPAETPGWREFKTLWFSVPSYQGPFTIRAKQLNGPGPIRLGGSGGLPTTAAPIVVPPGPTLNGGGGWRTDPSGTWAKRPGCYAWQIDGLTFSEIVVVHAVFLPSQRRS